MKHQNALFKAFFEYAYQALVVIDKKGIIKQFNPAAEQLFLYTESEAIGQNVTILMGSPHKEHHDDYLKHYLKTHISHDVVGKGREVTAQRKDGSSINIFIAVNEVNVEKNTYFIALITDVEQLIGERKALQNLAMLDPLTRTYTRGYFETNAHNWFSEFQKKQLPFSLLMLDLNNFKSINDELGHTIGDQLLITFSNRVQHCIAPHDYLVRLGGDEFLIIMQGDQKQASQLATTLLAACEKTYAMERNRVSILPSIGIYAEADTADLSRLLQRTDFALYAAKKSTCPIQFFTPHLEEKFHQQRNMEHLVREALLNEDFFYLLLQPQIDVLTKKIVGFEVLLRLKNREEVTPELFVPFIEKLGLGEKLNDILLNKLINLLQTFQWEPLKEKIKISFNISPQVYHFKNHLTVLLEKLEPFLKAHPQLYFEIELTESKLIANDMRHPARWEQITTLLKRYQVQLAIDDFAQEYSSIHRLLEYPVSTLKIDKVFIDQLSGTHGMATKEILKMLAKLGKSLDITMMAEGVETRQQVNQLKSLGYTIVQGFYFFHPLPPKEAFNLLNIKPLDEEKT
jgi:diguanylate cyclase (GGDEF)-like protein/PAS domain S-box-containing protein